MCVFTVHMVYFFNSHVPVKCHKIARDLGVGVACAKSLQASMGRGVSTGKKKKQKKNAIY